jgi:hypothetical protein
LLGVSRTIRGDTLIDYEFSRIVETDSGLTFVAQPSGQAPASFVARSVAPKRIIFENMAHDFPQRIIYQRVQNDSLFARIEGTMRGVVRTVDFRYRRVVCPGE